MYTENGDVIEWTVPSAYLPKGTFKIRSRRVPDLKGILEVNDSRKNYHRTATITAVPANVVKIEVVQLYYHSGELDKKERYIYDWETGELKESDELEEIEVD